MAEIDVRPKLERSNRPLWPWLLALAAAMVLIIALPRKARNGDENADRVAFNNTSENAAYASYTGNMRTARFDEINHPLIEVRAQGATTVYHMSEDDLFAERSADFKAGSAAALQQLAASIERRFPGRSLGIFTETPSRENGKLKGRRANALRDWLKEQGIDNSITIGELRPAPAGVLGKPGNGSLQVIVE